MSDFYDFDNESSQVNSIKDPVAAGMDPESTRMNPGKTDLTGNMEMTDFEKDIHAGTDFERIGTREPRDPDYHPVTDEEQRRNSQTGSAYTDSRSAGYRSPRSGTDYTDSADADYRSAKSGSPAPARDERNVTMENRYSSQYSSGQQADSARPRNNGRYSYRAGDGQTGGSGGGPNGPGGSGYNPYSRMPDDSGRRNNRRKSPVSGIIKLVAGAILFGVIAGATMVGINRFAGGSPSENTSQRIETTTDSADSGKKDTGGSQEIASSETTVSKVVQQVMPSVVSITGTYQTQGFFGFDGGEQQGAGSGFIIAQDDKSILIATNNHVVQDSTALTVGFIDGSSASAAIVGTDAEADLAVIAVKTADLKKDTLSKIKVAVLGDSDNLEVGQPVIAIGNALGYGQSVTTGVISAKDREVSFTDGTMTLLQTDAAINPGNSGGVLCDTSGKVIGINNAKLEDTSVEGMCYAIPITTANTILTDLMNADNIRTSEASYLGIVGKTINSSTSAALGIPSGVYVSQIVSGSPAEKAGLSAGDVITGFNGNNVSTMDGLKSKLSAKAAGTEITLTIQRANQNGEYKEKKVKVTLGKKSDYEDEVSENQQNQQNQQDQQQNGRSDEGQGMDPYDYFFGNGEGNGNGNDNGNGFNDGSQNDGYDNTSPFEYFFNNY